jgi:hypothetical protein
MGRALEAVRTRKLEGLFRYFGIDVQENLVAANRDAIAARFEAEISAIAQLCAGLREKERFTIVREALRLSYTSAIGR